MSRLAQIGLTVAFAALSQPAFSQTAPAPAAPPAAPAAPAAPLFSTTKVEGTDNVYIFRYQGHQSMFVVTPAGVIATDPIEQRRPQAVTTYIDEIKKITTAPIVYVIYSHSHFDHAAGGKPFKDLGAKFIGHKNVKAHLEATKHPDLVVPDEVVDNERTITLGGTTLELLYVGRNHSDDALVMRLPRERIIFAVDFIPIQSLQFRNMADANSPVELEESIKRVIALDWDRMIAGHAGPGGRQVGTKKDAEDHLAYLQELSAEVRKAAEAGKCLDAATREIKLPKYETWLGYQNWLPLNIERYCNYWNGGY